MRIAILDLGTNTFNIFVAEIFSDKTYSKLYKSKIPVKLGEGGINKNHIEPKPFRRGIKALKKHKKTAEEFGAENIFAFGTSAIRSANNGNDFIKAAKEKTGIDIKIISGDKEAELIYYGVRSAVKMDNTPSLIMDIGGGSTEFIIADKNKILWKQSFLLGAARLREKFHPSDPLTEPEKKKIEKHLEENLQPLFEAVKKFPVTELIGSSGSFDSLAEMIAYRYYDIGLLKGNTEYDFNLDDCKKLYDIILKSTIEERLHMKGLVKMRVDMIVVSAIFVDYVFEKLALKKMRLSRYSLKEGVLWEVLNNAQFVNSSAIRNS
ncbi:MAG: Ppx/GppA family phosphatase [Bacteroidetes bacterium]|nr:Ppx/GppA family phosphatase [Bacteroidota bacterium]